MYIVENDRNFMFNINNVNLDFARLDTDKDRYLNLEKDKISKQDGMKFFIPIGENLDSETFLLYNADKYGEVVLEENLAKREAIHKAYEEIKDKPKPVMGVQEPPIHEPSLADNEDDFWSNKAKENTYIIFLDSKIIYQNGKYTTPDRPDIEPAKNIYAISQILVADKSEKTKNEFDYKIDNAKNNEEKRAIIDSLLEDLCTWYSAFDSGFIKNNYKPGDEKKVVFGGISIYYKISNDYTPIFYKEYIYETYGCSKD